MVSAQVVRQEVPHHDRRVGRWLLAVTLDGGLSRGEGAVFIAGLAAYTVFLVVQSRRETRAQATARRSARPGD